MADVEDFERHYARTLRRRAGGGISDGMPPDIEFRLGALETEVKDLRSDVKQLRNDSAELKGQVKLMPTTFQMVSWLLGSMIAISGLVFTIARAMR
jgi:hypothetical protein